MRRITRLTVVLCLVVILMAALVLQSSACFTMIVGKDASETGQVMVTHNEDDGGRAMVDHGYVPAQDWPAGTVLPAEELPFPRSVIHWDITGRSSSRLPADIPMQMLTIMMLVFWLFPTATPAPR